MWKYRISLSVALFGLAALCGLLGSATLALFGTLALWFGTASFAWKGFRALLGKTGPPRAKSSTQQAAISRPGPARPAPASPGEVWQAVKSAAVSTGCGIARCYIALGLVLLVPMTLGLVIGGIVTLCKGQVLNSGLLFALAGCMGRVHCVRLLAMWRELAEDAGEDDADDDAGPPPEQVAAWRLSQRVFEIERDVRGCAPDADACTRSSGSGQPVRGGAGGPVEEPRRRPRFRVQLRGPARSPGDWWRLRKRGVATLGTVIDHVPPRQPFGKGLDRPVIAFADLRANQCTATPDIESRFVPVGEELPLVYLPGNTQCVKLRTDTSRLGPASLTIVILLILALVGWWTGILPTTDKGILSPIFIFTGSLGMLNGVSGLRRLLVLHRRGVRTTGTATRMYSKSDVGCGVVIDYFDSRNRRFQFTGEGESHSVGATVPVVYLRDDPTMVIADTPLRNLRSLVVPTLICLAFMAAGVLVLFLPGQ